MTLWGNRWFIGTSTLEGHQAKSGIIKGHGPRGHADTNEDAPGSVVYDHEAWATGL